MDQGRDAFIAAAGALYDEVKAWRGAHAEANIDEIVGQVTVLRRELLGKLVGELAEQHGHGEAATGVVCATCGEAMRHKGRLERGVLHREGESRLQRTYYYCPRCESGVFPPG